MKETSVNKLLKNKMIYNAGWLISGKVVNKLLAFFVSLLTARYLGPGNYGLINYATAYTTFFASLCTLGINSVIVKEFVDYPEETGETIGTTLLLRTISSVLSATLIVAIVAMVDRNETTTIVVAVLCSLGLVFQVFDTLNYWFQARLQSKYSALATTVAYVAVSAYKIVLLIMGKSVEWFAISTSVDYAVIALFLLICYRKQGGPSFSFSMEKAKLLLRKSSGFIVSGLMVSIYASTDKLMLKQMLDEASVGYYALAVSFSLMWTFVLSAIIDSTVPSIMRLHNEDRKKYEKRNKELYALVFYVAVAISAVISIAAKPIVHILYGEAFLPAVGVVRIVVWYTAFSYLGVARNTWVVCEEMQKYLKYIYAGSALLNVVLNALLIPYWGILGAATASLVTQISTIFVFPLLIKPLRDNTKLISEAILFKGIFSELKND